jgi:hypothetical protein
MRSVRPGSGGLLGLNVPWATLSGDSAEPGSLTQIGPITPAQARHLADLAATDPAVDWRIIVTSPVGQALAVARLPRVSPPALAGLARTPEFPRPGRTSGSPGRTSGSPGPDPDDPDASLIGRVTVTISQDTLTRRPLAGSAVLARAFDAAIRAAEQAAGQVAADIRAPGGCAHTQASLAYQPPPRLKDHVTARDLTCRFPTCRQPALRCDLDHSIPYQHGGRTCACNLGGLCRHHHQLKQHPRWQLTQSAPGHFIWTTPVGRTYTVTPDHHPI